MTINAIPTMYAGCQFRSRLEAKWAAFFDLMGWHWEYEPLDLDGYIPDFVIDSPHESGKTFKRLIEVKPALKLVDYEPAQKKIETSGWTGSAACVGATIGEVCGSVCLGSEWVSLEFWAPWTSSEYRIFDVWREAGNRVQWMGAANSNAIAPPLSDEPDLSVWKFDPETDIP